MSAETTTGESVTTESAEDGGGAAPAVLPDATPEPGKVADARAAAREAARAARKAARDAADRGAEAEPAMDEPSDDTLGAAKPVAQAAKQPEETAPEPRPGYEMRKYYQRVKARERELEETSRRLAAEKAEVERARAEAERERAGSVAVKPGESRLDALRRLAKAEGKTVEDVLRDANTEYIEHEKPEGAVRRLSERIEALEKRNLELEESAKKREVERERELEEQHVARSVAALAADVLDAATVKQFPALAAADEDDVNRIVRDFVNGGGIDRFVAAMRRPPTKDEWAQYISVDKRVAARHARYTSAGIGGEKPAGQAPTEKRPPRPIVSEASSDGATERGKAVNGARSQNLSPRDEARALAREMLRSGA